MYELQNIQHEIRRKNRFENAALLFYEILNGRTVLSDYYH